MARAGNIPWVGGRYIMDRGRYAMSKGVKMPWVGGQYTKDRTVDILLKGGSIYHG